MDRGDGRLSGATSGNLVRVILDEVRGVRVRRSLALSVANALPELWLDRARAALIRLAGAEIGSGTIIGGPIKVTGRTDGNLVVGSGCWINGGCHFDVSATISLGDRVSLGQDVLIITNSHRVGTRQRRADELVARPVSVGDGSWLGARSVIQPGVTIGSGAIVAAGAIVTHDVPANTLVGGVPAVVIKRLDV